MIILIHITIALAGIVFSSYALLSPSQTKMKVVMGLLAGTLASGTFLVVSTHANILQACLSGLLYTGFVGTMAGAAYYRMQRQRTGE